MAIASRLISLNLGSQTLGLAEFRVQPHGGLVLLDYRLREAPLDPATGQRREAHTALHETAVVLREMMHELRIKNGTVNCALPAQSVFARFVKLPSLEHQKLEKIIAFEAQQNVPFPIDDVVWDYQVVGGGLEEQIQVILVAIKHDLLDDVILFIEPRRIFSRSLPIGGSAITGAVAREFGESFEEAETRKKRDGFVGLGGAYAEPSDHDIARVSKLARSTMTRLHAELMRSVSHYRAQQQGNRPDRIFLCGGTAGLPYMREFFHEKFQLPIEFFNPLRNVAVSEAASASGVAQSAHLLGELVGLALRSVTVCPMELSLLPANVVRRQELGRRRPFFIAAAACVILAMLGWSVYYTRAAQVTRDTTQVIQEKNTSMRGAETQLDKLRKQIASLDGVATPLLAAINDRDFWPQILEDLNARLPEADIWITELGATSGGKLLGAGDKRAGQPASAPLPQTSAPGTKTAAASAKLIDGILVRGLYLYNPKQQEIVVDYLRNLANSPFFVVDPKTPERVIKSNSVPNDTEWAFPYELQLTLRKPVKLP